MALITLDRYQDSSQSEPCDDDKTVEGENDEPEPENEEFMEHGSILDKNISKCYFVVKGAAVILPHDECVHLHRRYCTSGGGARDIQKHLQSMFYLLRDGDILEIAVRLESIHPGRTRYLVVVSGKDQDKNDESCLLGIDCGSITTIGLVLPLFSDTQITLDGDGGFSVSSGGRQHIFKPVSVQAMWSALQTLHKVSDKARAYNYFTCGGTHQWIEYYEQRIQSDQSCLNEWHIMGDLQSKRPLCIDEAGFTPTEKEETQKVIRGKLKEIMMSVDLEEVTSKYIRKKLEEEMGQKLNKYKSYIDQEMLTILGQMDAPTEIFDYLYLGSEWNASNLEELRNKGVGHILNVTREIDNFFPGMFDYFNIRVYDEESTDMLPYWDKTFRYIRKAKNQGSKVLVHCKMGISRSASVVIAYAMKAYDWNLKQAIEYVKNKRNCIKPNSGFMKQLEIYEGILDASKQRHNSLWRSKSETNLKPPEQSKYPGKKDICGETYAPKQIPSFLTIPGIMCRPKSWSPDDGSADIFLPFNTENQGQSEDDWTKRRRLDTDPLCYGDVNQSNGDLLKVPPTCLPKVSSIKDRINELVSHVSSSLDPPKLDVPSRSGLVLNLATQFESCSKSNSPVDEGITFTVPVEDVEAVVSQTKPLVPKHQAVLIKPGPWDVVSNQHMLTISDEEMKSVERQAFKSESSDQLSQQSEADCNEVFSSNSRESVVLTPGNVKKQKEEFEIRTQLLRSSSKKHSDILPSKINTPYTKASHASPEVVSLTGSPAGENRVFLWSRQSSFTSTDSQSSLSSPSLYKDCTNAANDQKSRFLYDKESIPWMPGTVQRTKQEIEKKNPETSEGCISHSAPTTPSASIHVQRSQSLRYDKRSLSTMFPERYPLSVAGKSQKSANEAEDLCSCNNLQQQEMCHSISMPSVVEIVTESTNRTPNIVNSAIQKPLQMVQDESNVAVSPKPINHEDDISLLSRNLINSSVANKNTIEFGKYVSECVSPLIYGVVHQYQAARYLDGDDDDDIQMEAEENHNGVVKRITLELETKSSLGQVKNQPQEHQVSEKDTYSSMERSISLPSSPDVENKRILSNHKACSVLNSSCKNSFVSLKSPNCLSFSPSKLFCKPKLNTGLLQRGGAPSMPNLSFKS
ncbi:protein phosphatase Slingshot-like isoform X2 [Limulus polyphemus]|uniref:protein-serine/threonine phosphatase n=1 Tax=Limulus polyphemus TaxID=6850 RepID=A0ABM1C4Z1_LIMPO|nr:protein phosphatase Slingshot-like isoform X2 [Limulus polyphemus]